MRNRSFRYLLAVAFFCMSFEYSRAGFSSPTDKNLEHS